ncbi:MAG: extracellular solute-binding protein [Chloroflexi bacterium]|nr:extracellular solute-binding protein [Chloroflexota bacterium]
MTPSPSTRPILPPSPAPRGPAAATRRAFAVRVAAVGGAAGLGVPFAACGPAGGAAPTLSEQRGKIVFYTRGGEVETRGQQEILIPTFKKVAPNVEVVHEIFAAQPGDSYTTKLYTMYSAGTPPDVFGFGQNYMGFWARGMLMDLTPLITRDKYDLNQFLTGLPDKFKVKGKYYGIPQLTTFGTLLFYNKKLFDDAGVKYPPVDWDDRSWTYEKMVDIARRLTKNPGTPEAIYGLNYSPQRPTMYAWNFGGDAYLPEHWTNGIAPRTQLDSEASLRGHEFAQDVRWKHHVAPRTGTDPTTGINFIGGRYAMDVNGGWNFWGYTVIKDFKWAAAAIPHQANNKNVAYNDFWEMSSQTKEKEATWAFIKHLASPEVQKPYSELTGTPPTTKAAIDIWYKRYEGIMTRADLEKCVQSAIDPKRSQESADHLFIDWSQLSSYHGTEVGTPLDRREGSAKEIIARAKPGYDAIAKEIHDRYQGKTPT